MANLEDRIKALEEEICYLRKEIEKLNKREPIEIHYHSTTIMKTISPNDFPFMFPTD